MDGRVKTLHPKVAGGILGIRDKKEHVEAMKAHNIKRIDLIVVNLYPFREVISKGCTFEEAIENIDIGGPSMIRASAKNFKYVTVVIDPEDYSKTHGRHEGSQRAKHLKSFVSTVRKRSFRRRQSMTKPFIPISHRSGRGRRV